MPFDPDGIAKSVFVLAWLEMTRPGHLPGSAPHGVPWAGLAMCRLCRNALCGNDGTATGRGRGTGDQSIYPVAKSCGSVFL